MTARVYSLQLEKARLKRANQRPKGESDRQRDCYLRSHSSVAAFERAMHTDEYARFCREFGGNVRRNASDFLRKVDQVERGNAPLVIRAGMAATMAGSVRKNTTDLLHRAAALLGTDATVQGSHGKKFTRETGNVRS